MVLRRNTREIDLGFSRFDSELTDSPAQQTKVQILTSRPDANISLHPHFRYCPKCSSTKQHVSMQYMELQGSFLCTRCGSVVEPTKEKTLSSTEQEMDGPPTTHYDPFHKPSQSNNDPTTPFFISIDPNKKKKSEHTITFSSQDGRVKHIRTSNPAAINIKDEANYEEDYYNGRY